MPSLLYDYFKACSVAILALFCTATVTDPLHEANFSLSTKNQYVGIVCHDGVSSTMGLLQDFGLPKDGSS